MLCPRPNRRQVGYEFDSVEIIITSFLEHSLHLTNAVAVDVAKKTGQLYQYWIGPNPALMKSRYNLRQALQLFKRGRLSFHDEVNLCWYLQSDLMEPGEGTPFTDESNAYWKHNRRITWVRKQILASPDGMRRLQRKGQPIFKTHQMRIFIAETVQLVTTALPIDRRPKSGRQPKKGNKRFTHHALYSRFANLCNRLVEPVCRVSLEGTIYRNVVRPITGTDVKAICEQVQ